MRRTCAAHETPDEPVNCPVIGHLEGSFKLPRGPGNPQLGEAVEQLLLSYKAFHERREEKRMCCPSSVERIRFEIHILKSREETVSWSGLSCLPVSEQELVQAAQQDMRRLSYAGASL